MKQVDYGIDKPERVRALGMVGLVLVATGIAQFVALRNSVKGWPELILSVCLWIAILLFIGAGVMLWSSKSGKRKLAAMMVDKMHWKGSESVLDVGCGRGLLTVLAGAKIPQGKILGIDTWSQDDLSENFIDAAYENARLEGMQDRANFEDGDAVKLQYGNSCFDKVVSSLAIHGIRKREDRDRAVAEMIRVLRPGGELAILDILHTREYERVMREKGMQKIQRSPMKFLYCMPTRYIIAEKTHKA
jgi:ubiquinone/menaquinone biosynthesis C-methylase UbiE